MFLAGGDLDEIMAMHESVVQWAIDQGCEGMTLTGRKGWVKALQNNGWKPQQLILLEKRF